jgi:hypothetical protein
MRKLMAVTAVAVALAFTAGAAFASSCPKVIKEGREAAAKMKADDPKVMAAVAKLDEAQKLHDGGKHADSLKLANEAAADLGVKKSRRAAPVWRDAADHLAASRRSLLREVSRCDSRSAAQPCWP